VRGKVQPGRGEHEEDVVDRVRVSGTDDPLTIELMQEVVYLRLELAKAMKQVNSFILRETNHRRRE
jgi:hypothetical protein